MASYELLDESVEIPDHVLESLLDDMAMLDTFGHQTAKTNETEAHGRSLTTSLTVTIDGVEYTVKYEHLIKAFEGVLGELNNYPAAILSDGYVLQTANCIAKQDPNEIREDDLLEDLFKLALEAAGWKNPELSGRTDAPSL